MTVSFGPAVWILAAMAAFSAIVFLERFFELRRAGVDCRDFVKGVVNILSHGSEEEALAVCDDTRTPVAAVVAAAIRHRKGSRRALRDAVDSQGRAETGRLDRRLAALAIVAQTAPLVGLFGTMAGFIRTMMLFGSGEIVVKADLADATGGALVSAAAGLAVAIPVSVMYGILRVRLERIVSDLEAAASQIAEYLASPPEEMS